MLDVVDSRARVDRMLFARRDAGDPRARTELIERFLPLARSLARRYERSGEPLEDLVQVASLGLVKAIDGYDGERGVAFSSYAVPTIVGELKRYFRDRTWTVRPPRDLQELTLRVDRAAENLSAKLDRAPTVAELAAAIGATDEEVLEALQARGAHRGLSLQAPAGGHESNMVLQDMLGASDDGFAQAETRILLDGLLAALPGRSREVLRLRFEQDLTQAEIGALLGVSQMQISRIIRQAIEQVRHVAEFQERMALERVMG
jgi:RNA polymerase sigma-B factor